MSESQAWDDLSITMLRSEMGTWGGLPPHQSCQLDCLPDFPSPYVVPLSHDMEE